MRSFVALMTACCLLTVASIATAEDKDSSKSKMEKLTKPLKQLLVGKWTVKMVLDKKKAAAYMKKNGIPNEKIRRSVDRLAKLLNGSKLTFDIHADGTSETYSESPLPNGRKQVDKRKDTWVILKSKGRVATVKTTDTKTKEESTVNVRFISDDSFELTELTKDKDLSKLPLKPLVFRRVKKKK